MISAEEKRNSIAVKLKLIGNLAPIYLVVPWTHVWEEVMVAGLSQKYHDGLFATKILREERVKKSVLDTAIFYMRIDANTV